MSTKRIQAQKIITTTKIVRYGVFGDCFGGNDERKLFEQKS